MSIRSLVSIAAAAGFQLSAAELFGGEPWVFETVSGERSAPFDDKATKAIVLVFISPDCPVANYFQPSLRRIAAKHAPGGVKFVMLHPDPAVSKEMATKHALDYGLTAPVSLDPKFELARRLDAEYTPEAFLIDRSGKVHYRGRVNDMYVAWGKKRRAPKREDLDIAITEFLAGKAISVAKTKPVGCYINYPSTGDSKDLK